MMRRVADSLRRYEQRIDDLEARLAEADESADAVTRTMVAAQRTHDQLVEEASALAKRILVDADRDAIRVAHETSEQATTHLETARAEAAALLERAHHALTEAER
ncbi:MAG: hypothetical protein GTN89_16725, partial [Acidobacteria bacterium]|nr:hypothetical protein [Acidobacteriota bacterium]